MLTRTSPLENRLVMLIIQNYYKDRNNNLSLYVSKINSLAYFDVYFCLKNANGIILLVLCSDFISKYFKCYNNTVAVSLKNIIYLRRALASSGLGTLKTN